MRKGFCALFRKDCRMLVSGKFFLMAIAFLVLYTAYVNFGYIRFMQMPPYNVYLYDPVGTQTEASKRVVQGDVAGDTRASFSSNCSTRQICSCGRNCFGCSHAECGGGH